MNANDNVFFFDLETTGLLTEEGSKITTYGALGKEGVLVTSNPEEFIQFYLRCKSLSKASDDWRDKSKTVYPGFRIVSFNGKNFDVPFIKKQFSGDLTAPPLLLDIFIKDAESDIHVDLMAWSAKVFNDAAKGMTVKEIEAQMDSNSKLRIHKDDACRYLDIYVPKSLPAKACAIIGKRHLENPDSVPLRKRFEGIIKHCATDLFVTSQLYYALLEEEWIKE